MAPFTEIPGRTFRSIKSLTGYGHGPVARLNAYLRSLPPGDRLIARVLGLAVVITSLAGIVALERAYQVEVPVYGGTLTEGVIGAPRFVNPLLALSDTDRDLTALAYAGLMGYDANGNPVPVLAESFARSEDERTYTFTLRADAKFSDGSPVTADDVVFTVEKAKDPALKSPVLSNWANIEVEATDARTVRFTLPEPYAPFLEDATLGILPSSVWQGVSSEEFAFSPYASEPVGAGPFKMAGVTRDGDGRITQYDLVANPGYVLGRPYLDRIRFVVFEDNASLLSGLRGGQVESAYGVAREGALRAPYSRIFGVFFNPAAEPLFADEAVRHALSTAIDRPALVRDVLGGYATPSIGPVPAGTGVPDLLLPDPSMRVETARAMLEEDGWEWNGELQSWSRDGVALAVTLKTSNVPELKGLASKIESDWNAIGVPVTVELYPPGELTQSVIRPRDYGALLFGEVVGSYPDLYAFWHSDEREDPGLNVAGYANDEVDELLERARTETDRDAALADLARANERIASDFPAVFTHTPDFLYSIPEDLRGVALAHIIEPSDRFQGARYWYRRTEFIWPFLVK
ncbi:MAG: peptide/nickel transport system substrate-binding protein [Candidatus Parcubacteria bacterium]|jgi:peptide/nickel transport system substrate-binding protein|nr:peptide/nickel transport system substrate-binding protein [Candidatus Parcubacteria bacterium]